MESWKWCTKGCSKPALPRTMPMDSLTLSKNICPSHGPWSLLTTMVMRSRKGQRPEAVTAFLTSFQALWLGSLRQNPKNPSSWMAKNKACHPPPPWSQAMTRGGGMDSFGSLARSSRLSWRSFSPRRWCWRPVPTTRFRIRSTERSQWKPAVLFTFGISFLALFFCWSSAPWSDARRARASLNQASCTTWGKALSSDADASRGRS
eukprot:9893920-Lingulodinium_polyedra.AAC.1